MVLSRKKLKRKRAEEENVAALSNPDSGKEQAQVNAVGNGLQNKRKDRKRNKDVNAAGPDEGDGGAEAEKLLAEQIAARKKEKKEKKMVRRNKVAGEVAVARSNEDRLSNGELNGAVDHSEADAEPTLDNTERDARNENGVAENGGQMNEGRETESGDHKGMTVRERKGKKKRKDRWGGSVEEEGNQQESAVAAVDEDEEYKNQTSVGEADELSGGERYEPKKIYVGGMPYYVTEEDIVDYFSEFGKVTELDCVLFPDTGKFRGLAFITFQTDEAARKAVEKDGCQMGDRYLKITRCKVRAPQGDKRPLLGEVQKHEGCLSAYIGNLSWNITEDVLKEFLLANFKETKIEAIRFAFDKDSAEFRGFGHIDFGDDASLEAAIKLNQTHLLGRPVKIAYSVPKRAPPTRTDNFGQGTCHSCGKEGHKAFTCPTKGGSLPHTGGKVRRK